MITQLINVFTLYIDLRFLSTLLNPEEEDQEFIYFCIVYWLFSLQLLLNFCFERSKITDNIEVFEFERSHELLLVAACTGTHGFEDKLFHHFDHTVGIFGRHPSLCNFVEDESDFFESNECAGVLKVITWKIGEESLFQFFSKRAVHIVLICILFTCSLQSSHESAISCDRVIFASFLATEKCS